MESQITLLMYFAQKKRVRPYFHNVCTVHHLTICIQTNKMHKILVIRLSFPLEALHVSDYISPSSGATFYKLYIAFGISRYHTSGCCVAIACPFLVAFAFTLIHTICISVCRLALNWMALTTIHRHIPRCGRLQLMNSSSKFPALFVRTRDYFHVVLVYFVGHAVAQLVEALVASRKVAGSIPDGVIGIFHWHNPSCRSMALESTQPLTEMSTRNTFWR